MEPQRDEHDAWSLMRKESEDASGEGAPQAEMERIRQGLERFPQNLVEWETTCLKNVADLLDGLQVARSEWEKFSSRIGEMRTALEAAKLELTEAREEIERLKGEREGLESGRVDDAARSASHAAALAEMQETIDRAEAARTAAATELEDLQSERDALRGERDRLARRIEELRAECDDAAEALRAENERVASERDQLASARDELARRLEKAERERDLLAEAGRAQGRAQTDLKESRRRLEKAQGEIERLRNEAERNTVLTVEHRGRADRLEEKLDEARDDARKKARKVITKVHKCLDDAGAPYDGEMSYGERIRLLKRRIDHLETRLRG